MDFSSSTGMGGGALGQHPEGEGLSVAHHSHGAVEMLAQGDAATSEPVALAMAGDLVLAVVELAGEVLRQRAGAA